MVQGHWSCKDWRISCNTLDAMEAMDAKNAHIQERKQNFQLIGP